MVFRSYGLPRSAANPDHTGGRLSAVQSCAQVFLYHAITGCGVLALCLSKQQVANKHSSAGIMFRFKIKQKDDSRQ